MGLVVAVLLALQAATAEAAVEKGTRSLLGKAQQSGEERDIVLWTLVSVQMPQDDFVLKKLLQETLARPPQTTRDAALQAMTFQLLDPVAYRDRLGHCAQFLIDNQAADGRWGSGTPVDPPLLPPLPSAPGNGKKFCNPPQPPPRKITLGRRREGPKEGDAANSLWAALGLAACSQARIHGPADLSERAAAAWLRENADPADAVSGLAVHVYLQDKDWKKHPDVLKALERLAEQPRPTEPRALAALKRAMIHVDREKLGDREWWPDGVKVLVAAQAPDGSWGSLEDTCAALRYLHHFRHPPPFCPAQK